MPYITLLPYSHFGQSIACYSDRELVEALKAVAVSLPAVQRGHANNYQDEDMVLLWRGFTNALKIFGKICFDTVEKRNLSHSLNSAQVATLSKKVKRPWRKPLWLGWETLHSAHRGALLQHGEVELLYLRVIRLARLADASWASQQMRIKQWRRETGWSGLGSMRPRQLVGVHQSLDSSGASDLTAEDKNHYCQFNWAEPANGDIGVWPIDPQEDCYA